MKCWACKKDTMEMREDGRYWECSDCGTTENVRGSSDTKTPPLPKDQR